MLTHILAIIGLIALLTGWVLFQEWLRKNGKEFRPGCGGGCSSCATSNSGTTSCSTSIDTSASGETEGESTPQFVKIAPPKTK